MRICRGTSRASFPRQAPRVTYSPALLRKVPPCPPNRPPVVPFGLLPQIATWILRMFAQGTEGLFSSLPVPSRPKKLNPNSLPQQTGFAGRLPYEDGFDRSSIPGRPLQGPSLPPSNSDPRPPSEEDHESRIPSASSLFSSPYRTWRHKALSNMSLLNG